jgi:hypothetical protein
MCFSNINEEYHYKDQDWYMNEDFPIQQSIESDSEDSILLSEVSWSISIEKTFLIWYDTLCILYNAICNDYRALFSIRED